MDLYNYKERVSVAITRYQQSDDYNTRKVIEFTNKLIAENLSYARIWKYIYSLREIDKRLGGKSFDSVTKRDIENLISELNTSYYSEWTKHGYRVVIKRFWKWLKGDENYPTEVKWIKASCKQRNKIAIRPEDVLTTDEVRATAMFLPDCELYLLFISAIHRSDLVAGRT